MPDTEAVHAAAAQSAALVFGSLALRHEKNRFVLKKLLARKHWLRVFDVNLRPPYDDVQLVLALAPHTDVLKLNAGELLHLASMGERFHTDACAVEHLNSYELANRDGVW